MRKDQLVEVEGILIPVAIHQDLLVVTRQELPDGSQSSRRDPRRLTPVMKTAGQESIETVLTKEEIELREKNLKDTVEEKPTEKIENLEEIEKIEKKLEKNNVENYVKEAIRIE
jgi:hypothetical protein